MILIDTSVWIDHIRRRESELLELIAGDQALMHPFVLGEIALGNLRDRNRILRTFGRVPMSPVEIAGTVLRLIEEHGLHGTGIGYVDVHLVAATLRTDGDRLWTRDKRLGAVADRVGIRAGIE